MKTVLITGANRGLGKSLLDEFQAAGWHVLATARAPDKLNAPPNVTPLALDLADYGSITRLAEAVQANGRIVDLVINNAGYNPKDSDDKDYFQSTFRVAQFSGTNVAKSLHINALAPMELVSKLLPVLAEAAVVLNVSSWLGSIGAKTAPGHYGYAGSKALLNMFTRGLALEFAGTGRSAVALNPGWMQTDMGGAKAKVTPDEVAAQVRALHDTGALHDNNGAFLNADGTVHPW